MHQYHRMGMREVCRSFRKYENHLSCYILTSWCRYNTVWAHCSCFTEAVYGYMRILHRDNPMPGGYHWATLFLGQINTRTWPSRLGEPQNWYSKVWSWFPRDSDPDLQTTDPTSRQRGRLIITKSLNCLKIISRKRKEKNWLWVPVGDLTPLR
jgi:hypothetical protein